ncbi:dimethylamine monooxygenase subunit DmmA family protein [Streptomyces sp. NPDC056159]|uniref:dimethylamine monooxygenase subunit DmmA family protein n=1 Tax=Streptomyces sp. NPDC056159 TaxID=3155537 RepID=UPI003414B51C
MVSFGPDATAVADTWASSAASLGTPVRRLHADRFGSCIAGALEGHLAAAKVGWRLMLVGPEVDVLPAQALALTFGAIPAEIRAHATSANCRRVRCAHCVLTTEADVPVGETLSCPGCGHTLMVHHHLSRYHAAYLGFHADDEVAP